MANLEPEGGDGRDGQDGQTPDGAVTPPKKSKQRQYSPTATTGSPGHMECYGSMELDANDSSFFGDLVFTVWWHQDPRYFRLGKGSFGRRLFYSIERVFVTYNDAGHNVFYTSALAGTALAAGVSNLYYPKQDRGVGRTISRVAIDLGDTEIYNASASSGRKLIAGCGGDSGTAGQRVSKSGPAEANTGLMPSSCGRGCGIEWLRRGGRR